MVPSVTVITLGPRCRPHAIALQAMPNVALGRWCATASLGEC